MFWYILLLRITFPPEAVIETLRLLLHDYGMIALFVLILLEYACFPISSELVLPFAGAFAHSCHMSFFFIIPLSVLAGLIGTSVCYVIGRIGGSRLLLLFAKRFPKAKKSMDASVAKMERYGNLAVCLGRIIPICRTYIAFVAGSIKQPFLSYVSYSLLGITIWNCILIGLGYFLKSSWNEVQTYYKEYRFFLLLLLIPALFLLLFRKLHRKFHRKQ